MSGAWRGDYVLRIPAPDVTDPRRVPEWSRATGGGNSFVMDRDGLFATTMACHALALNDRLEAGEYDGIERDWTELAPHEETPDPDVEIVENTWEDENERCDEPLARPTSP